MSEIIIYRAEASVPGLADKIAKAHSISYVVPIEEWQADERAKINIRQVIANFGVALAGMSDDDLFFTKSIYVTTNWNKNDDVFGKIETWAARHTPSHKPTNIEHNEKSIVGHITDCWAMTLAGELISDNIAVEDLPNIYNIANGAVIYRSFRDKELSARANELINQIQAGKKYVSMECNFTAFDYAVQKSDGTCNVIPRDEQTAWMSKHLRAYGGEGQCEGYKVGRLLKNITFCGKGYVDKPANPNSIIFNDAALFDFTQNSKENASIQNNGVYLNRAVKAHNSEENFTMANEIDIFKTQLEEMKAQLQAAYSAKASAEEKLAKAGIEKYELQISELKAQLTNANEVKATLDTTAKNLTEAQAKVTDLTKKVDELTVASIALHRVSKLINAGVPCDIAERKVEIYASLNDAQFDCVAEDIITASTPVGQKGGPVKVKDVPDGKGPLTNKHRDVVDLKSTDKLNDGLDKQLPKAGHGNPDDEEGDSKVGHKKAKAEEVIHDADEALKSGNPSEEKEYQDPAKKVPDVSKYKVVLRDPQSDKTTGTSKKGESKKEIEDDEEDEATKGGEAEKMEAEEEKEYKKKGDGTKKDKDGDCCGADKDKSLDKKLQKDGTEGDEEPADMKGEKATKEKGDAVKQVSKDSIKTKNKNKEGDCAEGSDNADTDILDNAKEVSDPSLSVAGEATETKSLREELAAAIASQLGITLE